MKESKCPQFQYWLITLRMGCDLLLFLRSIRSRKFQLYKYAIAKILPWLFAHDHFRYARWLSVHLNDMIMLQDTCLTVYDAFLNSGNFVVSRTQNAFSAMGIDHRHEQLDKDVKGDGGAIRLTEDDDMLIRWMVSGPEIVRAVKEFEESSVLSQKFSK